MGIKEGEKREGGQDAGRLRAARGPSEAGVLGHQHAGKCKGGGENRVLLEPFLWRKRPFPHLQRCGLE
jgi:hypothetical protein